MSSAHPQWLTLGLGELTGLFHIMFVLYSFIFFDNLNIEILKIDPCRNKTHCIDCISLSTCLSQKTDVKRPGSRWFRITGPVIPGSFSATWILSILKAAWCFTKQKDTALNVSSKFQQQIMWLRHPKCMPRSSADRRRTHKNRHYNRRILPEGKQSPHSRPTRGEELIYCWVIFLG